MNNALFMTGIAMFFHVWGGAILGTALSKTTTGKFDLQVFLSIIGGAMLAIAPVFITIPTWKTLGQPIILVIEFAVLLLAIGIPMFVPIQYREAVFGLRTYWVWLGFGLVVCGVILIFGYQEMAQCAGLTTVLAGIWFVWRGARMLRRP